MFFKKILFILLCFITISLLINNKLINNNVNASDLFKINKVNEECILDGGLNYIDEDISFKRYNQSTYFDANFKAVTLPANNKQTHIVTWSATQSAKYQTTNMTLDKIAADYEKAHPGWMVLAGVNSEGWWDGVAPYTEISNTYVVDYKQLRTSVSGEQFKELIGFRRDNSHFIKRVPKYSETMQAWIYDENNKEVAKIPVSNINTLPTGNSLSVFDMNNNFNLDVSKYYVIKGNYDLYRPKTIDLAGATSLTDTADGILIEGKFTDETITNIAANEYNFYFVTDSLDIFNNLKKGVKTICQYEFLDEFAEAESVTGYMFKIIENNHVMTADDYQDNSPYNDSFYYRQHSYVTGESKNRSCIGFGSDGSITLAISYNNSQGPSCYSLGNVLQSMGINNAYQFDGGGSVTMIRRNEKGGFDILNPGAYGRNTSIATGIFFVCPKDDIVVSNVEKLSVTFENNNPNNTNIVVNINNKTYPMVDNKVTITNLSPATSYDYVINYDSLSYLDNKTIVSSKTAKRSFTTKDFEAPWIALNFSEITKSSAKVSINNNNLTNIVLFVGEEQFLIDDHTTEYYVNYLEPDTLYQAYLQYTIVDPDTSKEYNFTTTTFDLKTSKYDKPFIKSFNFRKDLNGILSFDYEIKDSDSRITSIALCYGDCYDDVKDLIGICKTSTILETTDVYLEINYLSDSDETLTINSDSYHYEVEVIDNPSTGCKSNAITYLIVFISLFNLLFIICRKK